MASTLLDAGAVQLLADFVPDSLALYALLVASVPWDERIRARKAMSYGAPYNYSGIEWPARPFPDALLPLLDRLAALLGWRPNNCLAHYYPGGGSTMGFHFDATDGLADGSGIAIVSLGATRTLTFRHQADRSRLEHYPLPSGSLLVMSLAMQADWKHAILVTEQAAGRISLTFRRMRAAPGAEV